jgi:hypothetical protein
MHTKHHLPQSISGLALVLAIGSMTADAGVANANTGTAEVKDNVIVACLLPARVRKLGGIVYPERRRLTQETAKRCELRGGEYTMYDRARPESAVAFFTPLANDGDATAQTQLGEVYEYLFDAPDYKQAAVWYRKAADQNDLTAARRLAHLYEFGLGVDKDPLLATNLWRRAMGVNDEFVLASTLDQAKTEADQRIAALTAQLRARNADADALARSLAAAQDTLAKEKASLASAENNITDLKQQIAGAQISKQRDDPERLAQLERSLAEAQRKLDDQRYQIDTKQIALDSQKAQLEANLKQTQLENDRLKQELANAAGASDAQLKQSEELLAQQSAQINELKQQQTQLVRQLTQQRDKLNAVVAELTVAQGGVAKSADAAARVKALEVERQQQSAALSQSETRARDLEQKLGAAENASRQLRTSLADAAHERERLEAQVATTEAGLVATRTNLAAAQANLEALRSEVVVARRERDEMVAHSQETPTLQGQIASRDATIKNLTTRIDQLVAETRELGAENQRLTEQRAQQLATRDFKDDPLPDTSHLKLPAGTELGKSYALVIGNNDYQSLRKLNFAQNDARRVYEALSRGYDFKADLLVDATSAQVFQKFEQLQGTLKPNDSLVVYFAGHGAQDGGASYWLGVDATADKSNWRTTAVSTDELNKWLDVISAKHVLVVADSCYSGAGIVSVGGIKLKTADIERQLEFALGGPSRTVISSGGSDPVPDGGAGDGSVFTKTFVGLLNENRGVMTDAEMFAHLKERVQFGNSAACAVPTPVFGRIESGGHVRGQFVFLSPRLEA